MAISLTENAAKQIKKQLDKRGKGLGLKLGVKQAGCSGYAYTIDYADAIQESDVIIDQYGVKLIIAQDDAKFLDGIELDFRREGLNESFKFNNPNVTGTCGCGESFSV